MTSGTALLPWPRLGGKVGDRQLERLAVVYVRQSTRQQVLDHGESTRLQYGLVERAVGLGWPTSRVLVIDEDLGKSGSSAAGRVGFQRLVTEITMGHVGLVLGIEMSRLARSGADWYQLLELCALSGALLADADGIYDPVDYNDRLLLGLKGTMSEAELHLLKQRMLAGKQAKARRGELAIGLPTGYVRRASGEAVLDPDEQVQTVVRLIFAKFAELGTLHGVLRWLVDHGVELGMRLHAGLDKGELVWRRPNRMTLQNILHSPVYAGIYAYGRRRVDPRRQVAGRPSTGRVVRAEDEWLVAIPGLLPAYITVEQYQTNRARLAANAARAETPGVVRAGSALLSGLARCGRCGRRMTVRYHVRGQATQPEYVCARQLTDYGAGQRCQALTGACVDALVTQQVLAALTPAGIAVSLRAAEQVQAGRAELGKLWAQRLERAQLDADRARRCYRLAEPENRLVVRQLEADWEAALAAQQQLREDYDRFTRTRPQPLTAAQQQAITALAGDIEGLWAAPTTTDADRKQLIRALVEQVAITVAGTSERVAVEITWAGGHTTRGQTIRPVARLEQLSSYPQLRERVRQLAEQGHRAQAIANRLHAEGFRPAKGRQRIGISAITQLLHQLGCPRAVRPRPHRPAARRRTRPRRVVAGRPGRRARHATHHPALLAPPRLGPRPPGVSPSLPVDHPRRPPPARRTPPAPIPPTGLVHPPTLGRRTITSPQRELRSCSQSTYMSAPWLTHLHRPADPGDADQFDKGGTGRAVADVVGELLAVVQAASCEQPMAFAGLAQRPDLDRHPVVDPRAFGAITGAQGLPGVPVDRGDEVLGRGGHKVHGDHVLGALDRQHVRYLARLQPQPQAGVAAIGLIAGDPGDRDASIQGALQHHAGELWLGLEPDLIGDGGPPAACPVGGPALGQVQLPVHQRRATTAGVGQEHPNLAVLLLAHGAGVLALDPGGLGAFLDEAGLVHHQHPSRITQVLDHIGAPIVADRIGVPAGMVEQPLHPVGCGIAGLLGQLPAILAFDRAE
jgi:DNA invertase Pin-like site-specific DNA recombinase